MKKAWLQHDPDVCLRLIRQRKFYPYRRAHHFFFSHKRTGFYVWVLFFPQILKVSENTIYIYIYICVYVCVRVDYFFLKHNFNNHVFVLLFNHVLYIVIRNNIRFYFEFDKTIEIHYGRKNLFPLLAAFYSIISFITWIVKLLTAC